MDTWIHILRQDLLNHSLKFSKCSTILELRSCRSYRYAQELSHHLYWGVSHSLSIGLTP